MFSDDPDEEYKLELVELTIHYSLSVNSQTFSCSKCTLEEGEVVLDIYNEIENSL